MKRRLTLMVIVLMVFALIFAAGCGGKTTDTSDESSDSASTQTDTSSDASDASSDDSTDDSDAATSFKIGSTANNVGTDAYQTQHDKTLRAYAEELGVELIQLDAVGDVTKQINQVDDLIQQECDVIIIWPVNGKALVPAAKKAYDAGIPVVIANSNIDESGYDYIKCFVGPNNVLEGQYAGEMMLDLFPDGATDR